MKRKLEIKYLKLTLFLFLNWETERIHDFWTKWMGKVKKYLIWHFKV